jgi:hypothetical protein
VCSVAYWIVKRRNETSPACRYYTIVSAMLAGLLAGVIATGRPDFTHLLYLSPMFFLILAWICDGRVIRSSLLSRVRPLLVLFLVISFTAFGLSLVLQPLNAQYTVPARRGTLKTRSKDEVVTYVQTHIASGQELFVYPYLPLYYYLTETINPTRYDFLMPGMHTAQQFQEAIGELAASQTPIILMEPSFREKIVAGFPSASSATLAAQDPVADYIATHYHACTSLSSQNFWRFLVMLRRDLKCPESSGS